MTEYEERKFNALVVVGVEELLKLQALRRRRKALFPRIKGLACSNLDCCKQIEREEGEWSPAIMRNAHGKEFAVVVCSSACATALRLKSKVRGYPSLVEHLK